MPSSLRGSDVNAWFSNREARRNETIGALAKLRDAQSKLAAVAGTATPIGQAPVAGESVDDLLKKSAALVSEVNQLTESIGDLERTEPAMHTNLAAEKTSIHRAAGQRVQYQEQLAERNANAARRAREQRLRNLRKVGVPVIVIVLFILMVQC